ncbi:glycosyltransferase [Nostocoides sp. F2B08]|uniref:glycosyltransferase family 4 protein n=1 Tax=Nostocoides sp. F2B08 TaxID=2653936 RepID=UPI001263DF43|nr:glycosyltransferase family 4 protein [Tetrasphaera sp. F2B08]KAB7744623.1 glycosyltransferase [Tetrasphaera sp. F2B08]
MLIAKSTGGIGTHVADLTAALRRQHHDVLVATDRLTASTFGWSEAHVVWPESRIETASAVRALRRLADGIDVLHAHGHQAGALGALAVRSLPRGRRPALVVSLHNAVLGGTGRRVVGALSAQPFTRTAQLVTGASTDLVEQALRWGASWAELAEVPSPRVPGLIATPPADRRQRRRDAATLLAAVGVHTEGDSDLVLTIARIAPQKDLGTLVAAAAADAAGDPNPPRIWVVAGGGESLLADRLREQAERTGAPLQLVGAQGDPAPWLRSAAVFVLTSHWEARALVVQEALAAGVPVVARNTGGLRDLVDGVGRLIDGSDPQQWADAVQALLSDDLAWSRAVAAGRERAREWDDGDRAATRWVARYVRARAMT